MWRVLEAAQDAVERSARHVRIEPAQHVVGAELDDDGIGSIRHRPVEPGKPAGCRVAGNAGILDFRRNAFRRQRLLQPGDEAIGRQQPQTGGQRIAKRHDLDRRLRVRCACPAEQSQATNGGPRDLEQSAPPPI